MLLLSLLLLLLVRTKYFKRFFQQMHPSQLQTVRLIITNQDNDEQWGQRLDGNLDLAVSFQHKLHLKKKKYKFWITNFILLTALKRCLLRFSIKSNYTLGNMFILYLAVLVISPGLSLYNLTRGYGRVNKQRNVQVNGV